MKLSLYSLLWSFPVPIILALAINQLRFKAYSYSTAIGLFNTVINIILLIVVNKIAKKAADVSFV